jgi:hypothetical protein
MDAAITIVSGGLCGLLGALPYAFAYRYSKRHHGSGVMPGLLAVMVSFAVELLALAAAWTVFQPHMVAIAVTCVVVFLGVVAALSGWYLRRPRL